MRHTPYQCCIETRHNVIPTYFHVSSYAPASGHVKKFGHFFLRPALTVCYRGSCLDTKLSLLSPFIDLPISYTDYAFYHFSWPLHTLWCSSYTVSLCVSLLPSWELRAS